MYIKKMLKPVLLAFCHSNTVSMSMQILPPSFVLLSICLACTEENLWTQEASRQMHSIYFQEKHAYGLSFAFWSPQKSKLCGEQQQM